MEVSELILYYKKIIRGFIRALKLRFFGRYIGQHYGILYKHKEKVTFFRGKKITAKINGDFARFKNYKEWKYIQTRKGEKGTFEYGWNLNRDKQVRHWDFAGISKGEMVLEVGFRDGYNLKYLEEKGVKVEGIEVNPVAVENAKKLGCVVFEEDIQMKTHYKDKEFDVVSACDVLEHCFAPENALKEMFRILKDSGRIVIEIPLEEEFQNNLLHGHTVLFHNEQKFKSFVESLNYRLIKMDTTDLTRNLFLLKKA